MRPAGISFISTIIITIVGVATFIVAAFHPFRMRNSLVAILVTIGDFGAKAFTVTSVDFRTASLLEGLPFAGTDGQVTIGVDMGEDRITGEVVTHQQFTKLVVKFDSTTLVASFANAFALGGGRRGSGVGLQEKRE